MLKSFKKLSPLILIFQITFGFSQEYERIINDTKIPTSIYQFSSKISTDINSSLNINDRLNLKSFKFIFLDEKSIEEGYFTIPLCKLSQSPTKFVYDSYNRIYQNAALKESFFKVSDLYKVRAKNPI